ncbi:Uncharacterised protein [Yersinia aldovae]|uniref:phage tail protein n=1 Tax=Yersinia aldovae TaxID=29483 RepID=UPI0005E097AD|nr:phage tail protein [Yersinia aldovae]CNJ03199.1 Uncharacterised protein [Yersinia aldovae]
MGSKGAKKVTVGYKYSWDVQAGIGRGPVNEIVVITADKKTVFAGTEGQVSGSTIFYIDKPNLFGGEDTGGEGGISGTLEVMMGGPYQQPSSALRKLLSGLVPGFRGMVTTFFSGVISSYSASPKPWIYRVRRSSKGWDGGSAWYPEKVRILLSNAQGQLDDEGSLTAAQKTNLRNIHAMNPAHILVECATNRDWGRGLSLDNDIDVDSYRRAADTLYAESFGLCFRYNRQDSLDTFMQQILDHIGAAQYGDLSTGKLTLTLLRDDYVVDALPLFTYDNGIIGVQDDDSTSADSAVNEVTVTYHDPVSNSDSEVRAQNLGAIQSVGLIGSTVEYPAIPTHELAARVAQRDLEMTAAGLTRLVIQFDRRGGILAPASVFRVSLPDRNIENMVLRVGKIDEGDDGTLKITAVQDVFGFPATSYSSGQQPGEWTPTDQSPYPVTDMQLIELPYTVLAGTVSSSDMAFISPISGYLGIMASAPTTLSINYQIQSRSVGGVFSDRTTGDWTPVGTLLADIGALDTGLALSMTFPPSAGDGAIIDGEMMRVDSVDVATGRITVGRGCADTLPTSHKLGSKIWFYHDAIGSDGVEYVSGEQAEARLLTRTGAGTLYPALGIPGSCLMRQRQFRPYLPGNIRLNSVLYPTQPAVASSYTLAFSHRDRLLQADRLIDCMQGSIGPEAGVQYVITLIRKDTQAIIRQLTTALESTPLPYSAGGAGAVLHDLTLHAVREGVISLNTWRVTLPAGHVTLN